MRRLKHSRHAAGQTTILVCDLHIAHVQNCPLPSCGSERASSAIWAATHQRAAEIVGILQKLKDGMPADLADSQREKEASKANRAGLTAATNLRQCDLGVEVDSVEGDLAETENSLAGDEASSEWEERQKSSVESPQFMRRLLWPSECTGGCAQRRRLWLACESAGNSTGGDAHSSTAMLRFFF